MSESSNGNKNSHLSRERIVETAHQLALKNPTSALSMRKIASELKVTPMAIYKYFADKSELTSAVIDTHMQSSNLTPDDLDPKDWRLWTRTAFTRMWEAFDAAPGMVHFMNNTSTLGPAVLSWQNDCLGVLINAGLPPKEALTAVATMAELATGSAILVPIRKQGMQKLFPTIWTDLMDGKVPDLEGFDTTAALEQYPYPWLMMCANSILEDMHDSRRAFGDELDLVLDGLELRLSSIKNA